MFENLITRREALKQSAAWLAIANAGLLVAGEQANPGNRQAPVRGDWPMTNGPDGNFSPPPYGHTLVDDLSRTRLAWRSEDTDLGFAKGSVSGYIQLLVRRPAHPGSCSGPIVADGKVFGTSFRPSGDVWAENQPQLRNLRQPYQGEEQQHLQRQLRIAADDLVLGVDQNTGRTVWKAVEEGRGLNRYMGKREGFGIAPAYFEGKVFSMGTTGRLYAYAADTGRKLWETHIGRGHENAEALKQRCLQDRVLPGNLGWNTSLVVVDGVLIVPLYEGATDIGLRGVNVTNGRTMWEIAGVTSRYATPTLYRHEGREYVVVANLRGEMRLIDPRTGRVQWTVQGLGPHYFSLVPSEDIILVNIGSRTPRREGDTRHHGLLAAYRISPTRAEQIWSLPDERRFWFPTWMDSCARRFLLHRDGLVYFRASGEDRRTDGRLFILRSTTGEVLADLECLYGSMQMLLLENRLLVFPDAAHGDRLTMQLFTADPNNFRRLGEEWRPPHTSTTAYEVFMEFPYVDGRLFVRTEAGDIRCYDLRQRG